MNKWTSYVTPINNNIVTNGLLLRMLAKFRRRRRKGAEGEMDLFLNIFNLGIGVDT